MPLSFPSLFSIARQAPSPGGLSDCISVKQSESLYVFCFLWLVEFQPNIDMYKHIERPPSFLYFSVYFEFFNRYT